MRNEKAAGPGNIPADALSHTCHHMQKKTTGEAAASASVSLNINRGRIKIFKYNMENTNAITFDGETLEEVETIT
ncbi:unnamed protein product [Schistosoma margrebowiei]|uniref:Uncharacterized protein n=1 Tax=Schistosoma margrebowiei TaxID=48269 RepID=A0A183LN77_9TREM|nr:unnamed protein product [Schistosoma margrebowiei]